MNKPFPSPRAAALALLTDHHDALNRRCGQFLGQLCTDGYPLSPKQREWLGQLLNRAGLPGLADGGE